LKIKLELFGASRDLSDKDHLEIEIQNKASIDDLRNEIIRYINKIFKVMKTLSKLLNPQHFVQKIMK